jgi:carboxylesterase type B
VWLQDRLVAAQHNAPVFVYQFVNASQAMQTARPELGAYHSCDTAFTFGTVPNASATDELLTKGS